MFKYVNSAVKPRLEVIFAKRGTCESREQCTGTPKETQRQIAIQTHSYWSSINNFYIYLSCTTIFVVHYLQLVEK